MEYKKVLRDFKPEKEFFVGIDSDGCVFPTMELKQKECFIPNIIKHWNLQTIAKYVREVDEWVNLYSIYRGTNRFVALAKVMELLSERAEIKKADFQLPDFSELKKFIDSGYPLSNSGLKSYLQEHPSDRLNKVLRWSELVNATVADMVYGVAPFPYVRESLEKLEKFADIIVVSATPLEILEKEWTEHKIAKYAKIIAGPEMGSKKEHIQLAAGNKYKADRILMVGDAPGDHKSAQENGALFYPIKSGYEEESWEQFYKEAIDKFLNNTYRGDYENRLISDFYKLLPETPYWKK